MTTQQHWMLAVIFLITGLCIHFLGPVLAPFAVSLVLAYLGDSLVDRLEKTGISRTLAVGIVFLAIFVVVTLLLLIVIPLVFQQLKGVIQMLPVWEAWLRTNVWPVIQNHLELDPKLFDLSEVAKNMAGQWQKAGGILAHLGVSVTRSSIALAGLVANLLLVPVVTFYLLRDWDRMVGNICMMIPRNVEPVVVGLGRECDEVLAAFLKGQLMVMLALGVIYSIGLSLVGLKFAVLIGLMAGIASIIPYMGFVIGFATAIVVAFFQFDGFVSLGLVALVFLISQLLESWVLTPYLVGDKIGLHPVAVIFALMAGGQLFGFVGMLIALPLAAIIMVLLRHLHRNYKASHLYHAEPPEK